MNIQDKLGILGFLLSVVLAFIELKRRRLNLLADHATIVPNIDEVFNFWVDLVVTNQSILPVSIISATITIDEHLGKLDNAALKIKNNFSVKTKTPVTVAPYESKILALSFFHSEISEQLFRIEKSNTGNLTIPIRLLIHTSRGDTEISANASYLSYEVWKVYRS